MATTSDAGSAKKKICFDYSHNNKLQLEETPFNSLMDFLAESRFLLAKSELGFVNQNYLQQFDCLVIGNMFDSFFEIEEIENIVRFVKEGGGLLLISDQGGDYDNRNNISELASQFGILFNADHLYDPVHFVDRKDFIVVKDFHPHFITQGIDHVVHSSGCSLTLSEEATTPDTVLDGIAFASESARHNSYNGIDWIDEECPGSVILAVAKYFKGKVAAIGNLSIFSSLGASYGLKVESDRLLVGNIFSWLLNQSSAAGENIERQVLVSVNLEESNYNWAMAQIKQEKWQNLSAMLNFALQTMRSATYKKVGSKPSATQKETSKSEVEKTQSQKSTEKAEETNGIEEKNAPKSVSPPSSTEETHPAKKIEKKPIKKSISKPASSKTHHNPPS
ncbi:MAG: hypothetical protein RBG13Loki_4403 [Promethearchaeota archaeon CR_4]|nr:MAG: hypothetical protein RBG13Loki_4403 [Candidatus Lokiarchaeota archaeon CR_4]